MRCANAPHSRPHDLSSRLVLTPPTVALMIKQDMLELMCRATPAAQSTAHHLLVANSIPRNVWSWQGQGKALHLLWDVSQEEQQQDDKPCAVLAMDAVHQDGVVVRVCKESQRPCNARLRLQTRHKRHGQWHEGGRGAHVYSQGWTAYHQGHSRAKAMGTGSCNVLPIQELPLQMNKRSAADQQATFQTGWWILKVVIKQHGAAGWCHNGVTNGTCMVFSMQLLDWSFCRPAGRQIVESSSLRPMPGNAGA